MALPPVINPRPPRPSIPPDPPRPDQGLPLPQPPYQDRADKVLLPPIGWLKALFPGFFDPASPIYIDPQSMIIVMLDIAEDFRPPCLSEKMQNLAQAYYAAWLLEDWTKHQDSGGGGGDLVTNSGIVLSEKEGDISVTYADPRTSASSGGGEVTTPPSSAWEKWNRLWKICQKGAILTKYGDPL